MPPSVLDTLRGQVTGAVVGPGEPGWDEARAAWNLAVDQRPAAVVQAAGVKDVTATLAFAVAAGLRVAPQGTGHGAPSLGPLADAILVRTSRMRNVEVDAARRRVRVGGGAVWSDVVGPAADAGLVGLHGLSGGVGVTGYVLEGGLGWLGRSHGLACHTVVALDVVLADGRAARLDADHEPDLFWALRGGGGAAAVVTALELELFPLRDAFAGQLAWPLAQAADVVEAYRSWTSGLPDELSSTIKLVRYPDAPELPPELRGQAFVLLTLVYAGTASSGAELVAPMRAVGAPARDTLATVAARDLPNVAGDPPGPLAGVGDTALLRELDLEAYLAVGGPDVQTALTSIELRHLGGALGRPALRHGAAEPIAAPFLLYALGVPSPAASADALRADLDAVKERLAPSSTDRTLLGFAERQAGVAGSFSVATTARLREVGARYDPDGIVLSSHVVTA